jgi:hypothetical protein
MSFSRREFMQVLAVASAGGMALDHKDVQKADVAELGQVVQPIARTGLGSQHVFVVQGTEGNKSYENLNSKSISDNSFEMLSFLAILTLALMMHISCASKSRMFASYRLRIVNI